MAGKIKLDGTQFLEKVNNEFKITNSELKLKSTGNTIVDSSGNAVVSESGGNVTLTADAAVIEGSSSGDLVRITQTGSGNALVVEDSANPDSTPFVVDSSGNVGVNTSSVVASDVGLEIRDKILAVTVSSGDSRIFLGGSTSPNHSAGQIRYDTSGNSLELYANSAERMRIDSNGNVLVGTTSTYTSTILNVNGEINATRFHTFRYNESGAGIKTFYFYANSSQSQGDFNYESYGTGHIFEISISASGPANEAGCVWTGWTDGDQAWRTMSSYSQGELGSFAFATGVTNGSGWLRITWNPYNTSNSCVYKINIRRINSHF